jgi:hypothetical protein
MVFEKDGYSESELVIPIEFVYCSSHPNPVEISVVKIPDVLIVTEKFVGQPCSKARTV